MVEARHLEMKFPVANGDIFELDLSHASGSDLEIYARIPQVYVEAGEPLPHDVGLSVRAPQIRLEEGGDRNAHQEVLLQDVGREDLEGAVAGILKTGFLSAAQDSQPSWPMIGVLYGPKDRPLVNAVFSRGGRSVNAFCLVDTGSPNTYMSVDTLRALGAADCTADCVRVLVHGEEMDVTLSSRNFEDLNLIGADFMRRTRTRLMIDYSSSRVELVWGETPKGSQVVSKVAGVFR